MMADESVMECPYATPGGVDRVEGRKALAKYLQGIGGVLEFESFATSPKT